MSLAKTKREPKQSFAKSNFRSFLCSFFLVRLVSEGRMKLDLLQKERHKAHCGVAAKCPGPKGSQREAMPGWLALRKQCS